MIQTDLRRAVALFDVEGSAPFASTEYVNYRAELDRATKKAIATADQRAKKIFVAFGYPGNGKGAFARELCRQLHSRGFSSLWLDVGLLIGSQEEILNEDLNLVAATLESESHRPLVLVLQDLDLLRPALRENPGLASLREILVLCSTNRCPAPLFVLATASSPAVAIAELGPIESLSLQFFNWPDRQKAEEFLRSLDIPHATEVVDNLFDFALNNRLRYTAKSLIDGTRQAIRVVLSLPGEPNADEVADAMRMFCSPTPEEEVKGYLFEHREYVAKAI